MAASNEAAAPAVVALVLAAGRARRFGSDKRRALLNNQVPLLQQTLQLATQVCDHVWVSLRPDDRASMTDLLGEWHHNPAIHPTWVADPDAGMGASLAAGIAAILAWQSHSQAQDRLDGVMVLLADMPFILPDTLHTLINAHGTEQITYPCYNTDSSVERGHPVIFGAQWLTELTQLTGDSGGKPVLQAHPAAHHPVAVNDSGILRDIDRPDELA